MSDAAEFQIKLEEGFPHLSEAPIAEAVIQIGAKARTDWTESVIREKLKANLPDYPQQSSHREITTELKLQDGQAPTQETKDMGWHGVRLRSEDGKHNVHSTRDGFLFSRLAPYPRWEEFSSEAFRLWEIHQRLAEPSDVLRLGLRFVNKIVVPVEGLVLRKVLPGSPEAPRGLNIPFSNFFHHDTLAVPGDKYAINLIRTIQRAPEPSPNVSLILDIDVFTTHAFEVESAEIQKRFTEMRWLKNKTFFGSVAQQILEQMK